MGLQLRFGVFGAALGVLIGIIGGIAGGLPFGVAILRMILSALIVALLGFALHFVIKTFLPELLQDTPGIDEIPPESGVPDTRGKNVDIVMPEEDYPSDEVVTNDDQAAPLRQMSAAGLYSDDSAEDTGEGLMEEVSEDRREKKLAGENGGNGSFSEDAFFQGVERLPDIGGFSEEFQEQDTDGTLVGEGGTPVASSTSGGRNSRSSGSKNTNMDPELIAKAIRTALKKDDH